MHDTLTLPDSDTLASLPIFPLPNCVLLPGGLLPLHVFEPRYRDLARDCLAGNHFMGVARLRPGFEQTYYGRPPVYERFGVGRIISLRRRLLRFCRFALVLRGVALRARARELPASIGRIARSKPACSSTPCAIPWRRSIITAGSSRCAIDSPR